MSNQKRREIILALLEENGKVSVNELARNMNVSEKTIRRDLTKMEQEGVLVRSHGGAVRPDPVELSMNQTQKVSEKSDGDVADKSDWDFTKNEQLEDELLEAEEAEEDEEPIASNPINEDDSEKSKENIKAVDSSRPKWLIKAIENTRSVTSEETEKSQSGYAVEPIKSLRDINLKELENSISPDTLAELMELASLEVLRELENVSELDEPAVEEEIENEELEGDEFEEVELAEPGDDEFEEVEFAEPGGDGFEEVELAEPGDDELEEVELAEPGDDGFEEVEFAELGDEGFEDGELAESGDDELEEVELAEPGVDEFKGEVLAHEEGESAKLGDDGFEDEVSAYDQLLDEEQYYGVTEKDDEQERLERSERLVLEARKNRKDRLAVTDIRRKPSERRKKTTSSKGRRKSPGGKNTKKTYTIRDILDWIHIILALIIFIGGVILAFYVIQTNRAQNLIINEGNIINESVICDHMSYFLTVDEYLIKSNDLHIRILF